MSWPANSNSYVDVATFKKAVNITNDSDDAFLRGLVIAASRVVDRLCNRDDGFKAADTASPRIYAGFGERYIWIDECIEITSLKMRDSITDTTYNVTFGEGEYQGFRGDPTSNRVNYNKVPYHGVILFPNATRTYFTAGDYSTKLGFEPATAQDVSQRTMIPTVQVTARWGYSEEPPEQITVATTAIAEQWYKRGQAGWADAIQSVSMGEMRYVKAVDPAVKMILNLSGFIRKTP